MINRNCFKLLIILLCSVGFIIAQNNQELFLQANQAYEQGEHKRALELYDTIANKSCTVWYNMGNCAYKCADLANATLYWKRAQRQADRTLHSAIEHNMQLVAKQQGLVTRQSNLVNMFGAVIKSLPVIAWQIIFLALWCFFCFLIVRIQKGRKLVILGNLVALLLVGNVLAMKHRSDCQTCAVVRDDAPVYIGPSCEFARHGSLKKAHLVSIEASSKQDGDWYKIKTLQTVDGSGEQMIGWISGQQLLVV